MKQLIFIIACLVGLFQAPVTAQVDTSAYQFIVNFDQTITQDSILAYLEELNAEEIWEIDDLDMALWEVKSFPVVLNSGEEVYDISTLIKRTRLKTKLKNVDFNFDVDIQNPADTGIVNDCFDPSLFQVTTGSESVKISILDSGISDLSDNNTLPYNYNLTSYTGYDYVNDDDIPDDENGHGTHLAGLIHSIVQYNTHSNITFDIRKTHGANGKAHLSDIVLAMYEAIEDDADIINVSFGGSLAFDPNEFYPLQRVIQEAEEEEVLVVCAAGNNGSDNSDFTNTMLPASFPEKNIIAVTASDCQSNLAPFANYGSGVVDFKTYGIDIPGPDLGTGVTYMSGTSQSTAIVTAMVALMATNDIDEMEEIKCEIADTGVPVWGLDGALPECSTDRSKVNIATDRFVVSPTIVEQSEFNITGQNIKNVKVYNAQGVLQIERNYDKETSVYVPIHSLSKGMFYVMINNKQTSQIILM